MSEVKLTQLVMLCGLAATLLAQNARFAMLLPGEA